MNELVTDLKALHEETLNNLKSSKAINTIRAVSYTHLRAHET